MNKQEFVVKVKEVSELVRSLCDDEGVSGYTSLYGFLRSAQMSLSLAESRSFSDYRPDVVSLSDGALIYDEKRD